jgi:hypothetical protein
MYHLPVCISHHPKHLSNYYLHPLHKFLHTPKNFFLCLPAWHLLLRHTLSMVLPTSISLWSIFVSSDSNLTFGYSDPPHTPSVLHKIAGNISFCIRCCNKYGKNVTPPYGMCIQHEEWKQFVTTGSGSPQSRFGNVYYHFNPKCIWFDARTLY